MFPPEQKVPGRVPGVRVEVARHVAVVGLEVVLADLWGGHGGGGVLVGGGDRGTAAPVVVAGRRHLQSVRRQVVVMPAVHERVYHLGATAPKDVTSHGYKNGVKRKLALESLAAKLNVTVAEVEKKIHNLKTSFNSERKKYSDNWIFSGKVHMVFVRIFAIPAASERIKGAARRKTFGNDGISRNYSE
ncbi:unnamed protein product [Callosobruchus maculatus]|uniref:MADF domain-containing protein n=1 Tax=Callosobruchus maculatus TaxID=64391 RepID=A0A653BKT0_CALMS|nr:unnamed protein product [Callosobruchus maculatus]